MKFINELNINICTSTVTRDFSNQHSFTNRYHYLEQLGRKASARDKPAITFYHFKLTRKQ
jgi:hypothetical protein